MIAAEGRTGAAKRSIAEMGDEAGKAGEEEAGLVEHESREITMEEMWRVMTHLPEIKEGFDNPVMQQPDKQMNEEVLA